MGLFLLQSLVWLLLYKKIRKRSSFFFHNAIDVDVPLLDAIFLSDLTTTCGGSVPNSIPKTTNRQPNNDPRRCSSPECGSPWPLGSCEQQQQHDNDNASLLLMGRSHTSPRTCGWCGQSVFVRFFQTLADQLAVRHKNECMERIVVYSVALGAAHEQFLWEPPQPYNATTQFGTKLDGVDILRRHGNCFFTFVLRNSTNAGSTPPTRTADGIDWVVTIPTNILPYTNHRRNTKLIKLQGHLIFPWAQRLIWQDTKFRRFDFSHTRPTDYNRWFNDHVVGNNDSTTGAAAAVCAGFYHLPSHENSFGPYALVADNDGGVHHHHHHHYRNHYLHHCETVVEALKIRHTVTDSMAALLHQCREYMQNAKGRFNVEILSRAMIDSAFMGWDLRQPHCQKFVADLTCTWLDELHCYSDRDQISFPHVIRSLQLHPKQQRYVDPVQTNVEFWRHGRPVARFTKSRCHWYFQELDACYPVAQPQ
jgi:hypothetical protein